MLLHILYFLIFIHTTINCSLDDILFFKGGGNVPLCSVESCQGARQYMEDFVFLSPSKHLACVFDGHGGSKVSNYLAANFYALFLRFLPSFESDW